MSWKTILDKAATVIQTAAARPGYYVPPDGEPISCLVFKEAGLDKMAMSFSTGFGDIRRSVRVLMEEIGELPQIGGFFTLNEVPNTVYIVEELDSTETNEYWAVCVVREDATVEKEVSGEVGVLTESDASFSE